MRHCRILSVCCVFVCLAAPLDAGEKEDKKVLKKLQGTWNIVRAEKGGQKIPNDDVNGLSMTIKGNKMMITLPNGQKQTHTFKIQSTFMPPLIDISPMGKDKKIQGIYKLEKKKLHLCVIHSGQNRPAAFTTKNDTDAILIVFQRAAD